jgi:hypothetical protein
MVIDTMVLTDSSFDENRKRCDPSMNLEFFEFQQQLFDFEFLSMNDDCVKRLVNTLEKPKQCFEFFLNTFQDVF